MLYCVFVYLTKTDILNVHGHHGNHRLRHRSLRHRSRRLMNGSHHRRLRSCRLMNGSRHHLNRSCVMDYRMMMTGILRPRFCWYCPYCGSDDRCMYCCALCRHIGYYRCNCRCHCGCSCGNCLRHGHGSCLYRCVDCRSSRYAYPLCGLRYSGYCKWHWHCVRSWFGM